MALKMAYNMCALQMYTLGYFLNSVGSCLSSSKLSSMRNVLPGSVTGLCSFFEQIHSGPLSSSLDPLATAAQKALEAIGSSLQKQYERWQPRVCTRSLTALEADLQCCREQQLGSLCSMARFFLSAGEVWKRGG